MILADTSAWVEYDRARTVRSSDESRQLIASGGTAVSVRTSHHWRCWRVRAVTSATWICVACLTFNTPAVRYCRGLRCRGTHLSTLPFRWLYTAGHVGLHNRSRGVAARGFIARAGCGPAIPGADRWDRVRPGVAAELSKCSERYDLISARALCATQALPRTGEQPVLSRAFGRLK